jgi:hypothetical protein
MENTEYKNNLLKALEQVQKEVFHLTVAQNDLINLYANPTSTVSFFYHKIESMFDMVFEERPMTLNDMADIIIEQEASRKWRFK